MKSDCRKFLYFLFLLSVCGILHAQHAQSDTIRLMKMKSGHLAASVMLQNKVEAKAMLESGIPFPILDSTFVFQNKEQMNIRIVPSEISMNFNGRKMRCYHQTTDTIFLNDRIYTGVTLIADLASRDIDMMYPVQSFVNPADSGSCIVELDIKNLFMRGITRSELGRVKEKYKLFRIQDDEYGKMYSLEAKLEIRDTARVSVVLNGRFIPDLGNVMFLALFENHPKVKEFIHNTNIRLQQGYDKKGQLLPMKVMLVPKCIFDDDEIFSDVVFITTPFYTQLKSDGFLGLDFLRRFSVIIDYGDNKFYIRRIEKEY